MASPSADAFPMFFDTRPITYATPPPVDARRTVASRDPSRSFVAYSGRPIPWVSRQPAGSNAAQTVLDADGRNPRDEGGAWLSTTRSSTRWCASGASTRPRTQVLRDISLGFFYGAKIGVLGLNGSGKTHVAAHHGGRRPGATAARPAASKGYTVGLLEQEPQLDDAKTVIEVIHEAVQPIVDLRTRFDEVTRGLRRTRRRLRRADRRAGRTAGPARPPRRLEPRVAPRVRHGRAPLPAGRHAGEAALGGRAAPGGPVPPAADRARHPAAWTSPPTTSTPNRWRGSSTTCATTRAPSSP